VTAPSPQHPWRQLQIAAWLAFAMHLAAALAMVLVIRHGLETSPELIRRLRFLSDHTAQWVGGWLIWNAAALSILYFYVSFAAAHAADGAARAALKYAVMLGTAAIAADLAAEAIEMGVLPGLARQLLGGADAALFHTLHRTAVMLTGFVANGLYTLAAFLAAVTTRVAYPRWVWLSGIGVGIFGAALSAMTLVESSTGMMWATAALMSCLLIWQAGVARTAAQRTGVR
jgi:hypothetical protein